jgi:dUTPase
MLLVKKLDPRAITPTCAHPGMDLAYDLYALEDTVLKPFAVTKVRTGIAALHTHKSGADYCPPKKDGLLIRDRGSMAAKGIMTSGGVVDVYTGEIIVLATLLHENRSPTEMIQYGASNYHWEHVSIPVQIMAGDKIAQMIPMMILTNEDIIVVEELAACDRGANAFGSTGR